MTPGLSVGSLLGVPVMLDDIELGRPVDVLVDTEQLRILGFEVRCTDDFVRFLPFAATKIGGDSIEVRSALLLLDDDRFYRERGRELALLRGTPVMRGRHGVGMLADLRIGADADISELVVDDGDGAVAIAVTPEIHLSRPPRAA